jgi:hypothetical protein
VAAAVAEARAEDAAHASPSSRPPKLARAASQAQSLQQEELLIAQAMQVLQESRRLRSTLTPATSGVLPSSENAFAMAEERNSSGGSRSTSLHQQEQHLEETGLGMATAEEGSGHESGASGSAGLVAAPVAAPGSDATHAAATTAIEALRAQAVTLLQQTYTSLGAPMQPMPAPASPLPCPPGLRTSVDGVAKSLQTSREP